MKVSPEIRPYLKAWVDAGRSLAEFFTVNPEMGNMGSYDLTEFDIEPNDKRLARLSDEVTKIKEESKPTDASIKVLALELTTLESKIGRQLKACKFEMERLQLVSQARQVRALIARFIQPKPTNETER